MNRVAAGFLCTGGEWILEARGAEDGVDKPKGVESTEENALAW